MWLFWILIGLAALSFVSRLVWSWRVQKAKRIVVADILRRRK